MTRLTAEAAWEQEILDAMTGKKPFGAKPVDPQTIIDRLRAETHRQEASLDLLGATLLRIISQTKITDPVTRSMIRDCMKDAARGEANGECPDCYGVRVTNGEICTTCGGADPDPTRIGVLAIFVGCGPAFLPNLESALRRVLDASAPNAPSHQVIKRLVAALHEAEYYQNPEAGEHP